MTETPAGLFGQEDCGYEGNGTEKDLDKAAEWYQKALEAGYEPSGEDLTCLKAVPGDEYQQ